MYLCHCQCSMNQCQCMYVLCTLALFALHFVCTYVDANILCVPVTQCVFYTLLCHWLCCVNTVSESMYFVSTCVRVWVFCEYLCHSTCMHCTFIRTFRCHFYYEQKYGKISVSTI